MVYPADLSRPPISVFLLDDHEIVRRGIADVLGVHHDIDVVGDAGSADEALRRIDALKPDVVILDVRLENAEGPDGPDGIAVCREVRSRHPEIRCLMLTSYDDNDAVVSAVMAGASGYLLKQVRGGEIVDAIRQVASGRSLIDPQVIEHLMAQVRGSKLNPMSSLSERERDVFDLIAEGLTNRQISQRLYLAEKTVKNHVTSLLGKLGLSSRTQAAIYASKLSQTG